CRALIGYHRLWMQAGCAAAVLEEALGNADGIARKNFHLRRDVDFDGPPAARDLRRTLLGVIRIAFGKFDSALNGHAADIGVLPGPFHFTEHEDRAQTDRLSRDLRVTQDLAVAKFCA